MTPESLFFIGGPCLLLLTSAVAIVSSSALLAHIAARWWIAGTERRVQRAQKRQARENELRKRKLFKAGGVVRV